MSRVGVNWHTGPAILYSKDVVRDRLPEIQPCPSEIVPYRDSQRTQAETGRSERQSFQIIR